MYSRGYNRSPVKRTSHYYSRRGMSSSDNSKNSRQEPVKKEYPLILLHCTILPPTLSLPVGFGIPDQRILKEVLPPLYWRRWKLLEDKIGFGVVRDRGVLISHPQDMYDLLEERLLESLELQRPRVQGGHFTPLEREDVNMSWEEEEAESATDDEQGHMCPDCGHKVVHLDKEDGNRKWEVRVLAANGLMKAGAWAAAWKEMEKVDVEVGLWLPSDVRRELERRVLEEQSNFYDISRASSPMVMPEAAVHMPFETSPLFDPRNHHHHYSSPTRDFVTQEQIDGLDSPAEQPSHSPEPESVPTQVPKEQQQKGPKPTDIDLTTLVKNYICILASDKRNITIILLSIVVVVFAIFSYQPFGNGGQQSSLSKDILLESGPAMTTSSAVTASSTLQSQAVQSSTEPAIMSRIDNLGEEDNHRDNREHEHEHEKEHEFTVSDPKQSSTEPGIMSRMDNLGEDNHDSHEHEHEHEHQHKHMHESTASDPKQSSTEPTIMSRIDNVGEDNHADSHKEEHEHEHESTASEPKSVEAADLVVT